MDTPLSSAANLLHLRQEIEKFTRLRDVHSLHSSRWLELNEAVLLLEVQFIQAENSQQPGALG